MVHGEATVLYKCDATLANVADSTCATGMHDACIVQVAAVYTHPSMRTLVHTHSSERAR